MDSHNRLFGEESPSMPTARPYHRSNIPFGSDATDAPKSMTNGNGTAATNGNGTMNGNGHDSAKGHNGDLNGHTNGTTNGSKHGKWCLTNWNFVIRYLLKPPLNSIPFVSPLKLFRLFISISKMNDRNFMLK